ncbi:MAG: penicillin-binding protein 1A [Pseudomonadota bacterium]
MEFITENSQDIHADKRQKRKSRGNLFLRLLGIAFTVGVLFFVIISAVIGYTLIHFSQDLPSYEKLAEYAPPVMTRIHANDGKLIDEYGDERRIYVPINAIPKRVIHAFLSAEDKTFFQHSGLDPVGILAAAFRNWRNLGSGRRAVGASTITQQVAKNFLLTNERRLERKVKEAILAIRIERAFSKEKIIELYLNKIFLGFRSYGIAAAGLNYFGKSLQELTIEEAAYIAALPKGPNNYHPFRFRKKATARRNWVIGQMLSNGYISVAEAAKAKARPLKVNPRQFGNRIFAADFFAEEVRKQLVDRFGKDKVYTGGLSVRTTLDPNLQKLARKALVKGLVRYDRSFGWRGPVKQIEITGDWGNVFRDISWLDDIKPWRQAVVLEVDKGKAKIGLRPKRLKSGQLASERLTGIIPREEIRWAAPFKEYKKYNPNRKQKSVKSVADVLSRGDIIYVSQRMIKPKKKKKKNAQEQKEKIVPGEWSLMQIPQVQGSIVVMDPHTGRIHALVGGFSFDASKFNRVTQAIRQPGSSFKPFVYATALDNGYSPASVMLDAPVAIEQGPGQELWKPKNYGKKFYGPSTLRRGIEKSRNLMTVRLANDMGMPLITEYSRRFGIYDDLTPVLSMSLGAGETTLLRMTTAYCMLANGGKKVTASLIDRIQDRTGATIWRHDGRSCPNCQVEDWNGQQEPVLSDNREQIISSHTAYQITSMLEGVVKRGTGIRVKAVGKPLAGKTGTTNDEKDAWFIGFSPDLVVGVFIGFDTPQPMGKGATGGGLASPIFRDFMKMTLADQPAIPFRIPSGIKLIRINGNTGQRAQPGDRNAILEAFKPNESPPDGLNNLIGPGEGSWNPGESVSQPQPGGLY